MTLEELNYPLPPELIAQHPLEPRDAARMLVVYRREGRFSDDGVLNLPAYLKQGDLLVVNESYVLPARFWLRRKTGGRIEGLFVRALEEPAGVWEVLLRWAGALRVGERLRFEPPSSTSVSLVTPPRDTARMLVIPAQTCTSISPVPDKNDRRDAGPTVCSFSAELLARKGGGYYHFRVEPTKSALEVLGQVGVVPLPKYIERPAEAEDAASYQTIFAEPQQAGSVAAPTAGLHFTPRLLAKLGAAGIGIVKVTLHVGPGTFKPISTPQVEAHVMHPEHYEVSPETAAAIGRAKAGGRRVIAVGSTSLRTLEATGGKAGSGWTDIFIHPPYRLQAADAMFTNFHLPHSTLLALVMAVGGSDLIRRAYAHAVAERYRFFSYGDAMLIL